MARRGFTLLEVMCAFAVLTIVTSFMTVIWSDSIDKAETAIDQRELREVADTVFGRILFEEQEHDDGDSETLDIAYGHWAQLPQVKADRYYRFTYLLEKKLTTASGAPSRDGDTENLFGDTETDDEETTPSSATSDEAQSSVELWRYTMRIVLTEDANPEAPLITLQTYRKPSESAMSTK